MALETETLSEFFREQIAKAQRHQHVPLREGTQFYVVNLLSAYLYADRLYRTASGGPNDEPLAITFAKAIQARSPLEQLNLFKSIGDRTLYLSGFFGDSFKRNIVDIDYYISMGETAYGSVSTLAKENNRKDVFTEVFDELSKKFVRLVNVLAEISETTGVASDADVLRLYERWLMTKSEHLSEQLKERGILPVASERGPLH